MDLHVAYPPSVARHRPMSAGKHTLLCRSMTEERVSCLVNLIRNYGMALPSA